MRYELDANGYVIAVFWGCHSGNCAEYTGKVPYGYTDLNDWSENALINAYYLEKGNLVLDPDKLAELEEKIEQDSIDNEPVLRKDLYGTTDVLNSQYQQATIKEQVIAIDNVKRINPKVKITDIECYNFDKVDIITQGKNMLQNDAKTETISGVKFIKNTDGSIAINGKATANIKYNLSGSGENTTSIFVLKKGLDYYLNLDGLDCEMKYYDGTTSQVYTGASGLINLSESKEVTQVLIKIPSGTTVNTVIYPMLEYGTTASKYEEYKSRRITIDFSEFISPEGTSIDYIYIENGSIYISVDGVQSYLMRGNVNLFDGFNTVYTMQDATIEMTYCINNLKLEGTVTKNNNFKVKEDGSIEAHNGNFSGKITADNGSVGGWNINETQLYCDIQPPFDYYQEDLDKLQAYLRGETTLTEEETIKYDVDGNGVIDLFDLLKMQKCIWYNLKNSDPGELIFDTSDWFTPIKIIDSSGKILSSFGVDGVSTATNEWSDLSVYDLGNTNLTVYSFKTNGKRVILDINVSVKSTLSAGSTIDVCEIPFGCIPKAFVSEFAFSTTKTGVLWFERDTNVLKLRNLSGNFEKSNGLNVCLRWDLLPEDEEQ